KVILRTSAVAVLITCVSSTWPGARAQQAATSPAPTRPTPTLPAPTPVTGFVGSNPCRTCHPDVWARFYKNPHFKSIASGKEPPERTGCESCHGPGKAHVEAHGGKATIVAFSQLEQREILDNCLRCHSATLTRANIRRSSHTLNGVVCTNCHSI